MRRSPTQASHNHLHPHLSPAHPHPEARDSPMEQELAVKSLQPLWTTAPAPPQTGTRDPWGAGGLGLASPSAARNTRHIPGDTDDEKSAETSGVSCVSSDSGEDSLSFSLSLGGRSLGGSGAPVMASLPLHVRPSVGAGEAVGVAACSASSTTTTTSATSVTTTVTSATSGGIGSGGGGGAGAGGADVSVSSGRIMQTVAALKSPMGVQQGGSGFSSPKRRAPGPMVPANASASGQYRQVHGGPRSVSPCSPLAAPHPAGAGAGAAG